MIQILSPLTPGPTNTPRENVILWIILVFSILVAVAFLVSLGAMLYFRFKDPKADIALWLNMFFTTLGYVVGILTGLLGIPKPKP